MKLDSWWSRSWKRIDLIKIDVEGAEPLVLLGARELLALPPEQAPVLIIEDGSARWPHFGHAPSMVGSLLTKYGYSIYVYRPRCGLVPATLPLSAVDPFAFDGNLLAAKRKLALVDM